MPTALGLVSDGIQGLCMSNNSAKDTAYKDSVAASTQDACGVLTSLLEAAMGFFLLGLCAVS
jgi:hypothetical protein